ncbi:MAG: 4-(cytidine 5'-diphospho)-2-C-methyl-D-erythritol kinase [Planctomycetes bacterium]|nr:4-(cytidine 5'-diphospho)-2-C-methyl-D-erythritol kinase [Planctomycetota bacterium]
MRLAAPCKTNLFLEVLARRADGFHELDTVFTALDLEDALELEPLPGGRLELVVEGDPTVPADASNLVWRAAEALRAAAGRPELGARLRVEKRVPAGGGLGGGSSDAAAALLGLDRLWGLDLGDERLHALAAGLGSDVPFFLRGGLQRGLGRGERLEPLPAPARPLDLVLVLPGFSCPTGQVYGALAPFLPGRGGPPARDAGPLLAALARGDLPGVAEHAWNRLELAAEACFPALRELRERLARAPGVLTARLSGSGSTLWALAASRDDAERLARDLAGPGLRARVARTAC